MKKLLLIILLLFTFTCKGQWISANINYAPSHIFEPKELQFDFGYYLGNDDLRIGAFAKSFDNFEHVALGLQGYVTIVGRHVEAFKDERNLNISLVTAWGCFPGRHNEDSWGNPHRSHFSEVGINVNLETGSDFSVDVFFKNQYWTSENPIFYEGIGVAYKIK